MTLLDEIKSGESRTLESAINSENGDKIGDKSAINTKNGDN